MDFSNDIDPGAQDSPELAVAGSFLHPAEAHLAKSRLEDEGIECHLVDEHTVAMNWFYSNLLGGVKVMVEGADLERARQVLGEDASALLQEELGHEAAEGCPRCGTERPRTRSAVRKRGALSLLLGHLPLVGDLLFRIPFPSQEGEEACPNCGHRWSDPV